MTKAVLGVLGSLVLAAGIWMGASDVASACTTNNCRSDSGTTSGGKLMEEVDQPITMAGCTTSDCRSEGKLIEEPAASKSSSEIIVGGCISSDCYKDERTDTDVLTNEAAGKAARPEAIDVAGCSGYKLLI